MPTSRPLSERTMRLSQVATSVAERTGPRKERTSRYSRSASAPQIHGATSGAAAASTGRAVAAALGMRSDACSQRRPGSAAGAEMTERVVIVRAIRAASIERGTCMRASSGKCFEEPKTG